MAEVPETQKAVPALYPDEIRMKAVAEILGLTSQRTRTLTHQGKIPTAKQNANDVWCYSRKAVEEYAKNRVARTSDGRKPYKTRLNDQELALIEKAVAGTGIKFTPVKYYNKPKVKGDKVPKPAPMPGLPK